MDTWDTLEAVPDLNLPHSNQWYELLAETVIETNKVRILWDFNIQTDKVMDVRRPDIVVTNKDERESWIIDNAIPGDQRVREKEIEKREKYQDLAMEIRRLWKTSVNVVPIVIGALGTIGDARSDLEMLGIIDGTDMIQTAALLVSAHILRKTLSL